MRLHKLVESGGLISTDRWVVYSVAWCVFILCGGACTVAWKPESEFKAIWVGVSWPLLVAALLQAAPAIPK